MSENQVTQAFVQQIEACLELAAQPAIAACWRTFDDLLLAFERLDSSALDMLEGMLELPVLLAPARAAARRAVQRFPDNARAWYLHGRSLLLGDRQFSAALESLERAWSIDPCADPLLPLCMSAALLGERRWSHAERMCRLALKRWPDSADAYSNLSAALRGQYRSEEALDAARHALALAPDNTHAPAQLSLALMDCWRFEEARDYLRDVVRRQPESGNLRLMLGEIELRLGQWSSGWANMHARFHLPELRAQLERRERECGIPIWRGEPLQGRTLGIWLEQGYGDAILLVRYLPLLAERVCAMGGRLVFGCFAPLLELFRPLVPPGVALDVDQLRPTDFHLPLMTACASFDLEPSMLSDRPYLSADPQRIATWRKRIGGGDGRLHVALAWTGNPDQVRNDIRSLTSSALDSLLDIGGVTFHSLNPAVAEHVRELQGWGFDIQDWSACLHDFGDSAALISSVDLVITTCTASAHLAGAVGAPTLLMLDRVASFFWGLEEHRTCWYDSVRLLRQARLGDWSDVVARVHQELAQRLNCLPSHRTESASLRRIA